MSASESPTGQDQKVDLLAAVQAYSDAYLTGDPASFGMLSKRCQSAIGKGAFLADVAVAKAQFGSPLPIESFTVQLGGDLARVTYTYSVASIDQSGQPWVREGGSWRYDSC